MCWYYREAGSISAPLFHLSNSLLLSDISSNMLRAPSSRASIAIIFALISILPWPTHSAKISYVQEACSVTQHQDLCIQLLTPFSSSAKRSPTKWARAAVSVTISEAKTVARFLGRVKNNKRFMGRNRAAVYDCVEVFEAAIDELHRSLGVLRRLRGILTPKWGISIRGLAQRWQVKILAWMDFEGKVEK